jgi:nitrate reductase assembly molybdenum cofactor insertion protein NarJ
MVSVLPSVAHRPEIPFRDSGSVEIAQLHPQNTCLARLLNYSDEQLANADIAETNLIAALCLPGSEDLVIPRCIDKLDEWAELVRLNMNRYWRLFERSPEQFGHFEGHYRMMMLA